MKNNFYLLGAIVCLFFSCHSVDKFNAHLEAKIPVDQLKKEVDFVQNKLYKWHPALDWYSPKDSIDDRFKRLKSELTEPLTPNEFYFKLAPTIAQLRHGHTHVSPLQPKRSKEKEKRIKDSKGPFSQLGWMWVNDQLFLTVNQTFDKSLPIGAKVTKIQGIDPKFIYQKYAPTENGDGWNETHKLNRLNRSFASYFTTEYGVQDSLCLELVLKNDTLQKVVRRRWETKPATVEKKPMVDSLKKPIIPMVAKPVQLPVLALAYNKSTKKFTKTLSFPTNDSAIAMLKITSFSKGNYKGDYQKIFKQLANFKTKHLVLDVRDNGGGLVRDAAQLYAYLGENPREFIQTATTTSKSSVSHAIFQSVPLYAYPITWIAGVYTYLKTTKEQGTYRYSIYVPKHLKMESLIFSGSVHVLINGGSYSATSFLAGNLKSTGRAVLVGEATGGDYNGTVAGIMPRYTLPVSRLKLQLGVMKIPSFHQINAVGESVDPDFMVIPQLEEVLQKKDPLRDFALKRLVDNE